MTLVELLVVIAIIAIFISMVDIGVSPQAKRRAQRINCVSNLKQINLSIRLWEGDVETNDPVAGQTRFINAVDWFRSMSNQLETPKILICPADLDHPTAATNFQNDFNSSHISYFISPDANETYPQMIMTGDDNLATNGIPMKSGLHEIPANAVVSWLPGRHGRVNNIGYADGSVAEVSDKGLQQAIILGTNGTPGINRIAIP